MRLCVIVWLFFCCCCFFFVFLFFFGGGGCFWFVCLVWFGLVLGWFIFFWGGGGEGVIQAITFHIFSSAPPPNWETLLWYAVISIHGQVCGTNTAPTSRDMHYLKAALSDVLFTPVSTTRPTHPGTRQGDTDSTVDLALVSLKLVPWTRAETFASHGSDHLPVVFSLQKPGIEQRRKLQYPFQYGKSNMGVMSKLRAHKPAHTTNPRQKAAIQPPWWNKETQAAWTDKRTIVKLWQKEKSKPHPDLTIKAHMDEKTEVFKRVASEAKDKQWKSLCDTLNRDTTLTHFWQFYRQMKGLSTTPTLRPGEQSKQSVWKESNLEMAGQNPDRSRVEWRPDHTAGIHRSTFKAEQRYSSWSWQGQILRH